MRNFRRHLSVLGFVLLGATGLVGCGDDAGDSDGNLRVDVIGWGPDQAGTLGFQAGLPEFLNAQDVRVSLRQPGAGETLSSEVFSAANKAGTLPELKNGEGYRLDFELLDAVGRPVAMGATPLFDMVSGEKNRQRFKIQVDQVDDFAPVGAVINSALTQSVFDYRALQARGVDRWLGRIGQQMVTYDNGNRALIVAGGDTGDQPARAGAAPAFRSLHDDLIEFDPESGYFTDLAYDEESQNIYPGRGGRLRAARAFHTLTPIGEDKFLVIGGLGASGVDTQAVGHIELIDMRAEPSQRVQGLQGADGALELSAPRAHHSATYRPHTNTVVVAGGIGAGGPSDVLDSVEIIDLTNNTVTSGPAMGAARANHQAVLMGEGSAEALWFIGGRDAAQALKSTEMLSASNTIEESIQMGSGRYDFGVVKLSPLNGNGIMVVGGYTDLDGAVSDTFELGLPARGEFLGTGGQFKMEAGRGNPNAIELPNSNDVVVLGGRDANRARVSEAEVIRFNSLSDLNRPYIAEATGTSSYNKRADGSAVMLSNGKILLAGGFGGEGVTTDRAEYFTPFDPIEQFVQPEDPQPEQPEEPEP